MKELPLCKDTSAKKYLHQYDGQDVAVLEPILRQKDIEYNKNQWAGIM